mmetsp:Transcript_30466/g.29846  ORF Transcript_30466/g.29846 Transcript_30466/m.29846 type:complete len:91 (+) Transcript_30466:294-566(+)|eukprot:CAMPEP_0170549460 /NCGR_PEP_ID=MMETSP0211-20121228/7618_1 /TAXON_ID=311385 /ORGANISM="Pseudokeronopsis sp., Strain OXSARD2" /LENGTH=90 /DNA_ID=CAMNT_0010855495 /DNA_START=168 /DNA_END=440 /DNA_ORIENTATION=+
MINELYVTKNKYFDKHPKLYNVLKVLAGENIVLIPTNELYLEKRKHLSIAFYKEKMVGMFERIIAMTDAKVKTWVTTYTAGPENLDMNLY